jgi:hypothetical protein
LRYTEDFFAMFDEVAAGISSSAAGDIFEMGSSVSYIGHDCRGVSTNWRTCK